jgi:hypothetical protein
LLLLKVVLVVGAALVWASSASAVDFPPREIGWENECDSAGDWLSNRVDPAIGTRVGMEGLSVVQVTQDGEGTWGKAAIRVDGVDVNATPVLEAAVTKVDLNSAFQVAIAPPDWSEMVTVIKRTSADGIHRGDLHKAIRRAGNPSAFESGFFVVVIVEGKGKSVWLDRVRVQSKR